MNPHHQPARPQSHEFAKGLLFQKDGRATFVGLSVALMHFALGT